MQRLIRLLTITLLLSSAAICSVQAQNVLLYDSNSATNYGQAGGLPASGAFAAPTAGGAVGPSGSGMADLHGGVWQVFGTTPAYIQGTSEGASPWLRDDLTFPALGTGYASQVMVITYPASSTAGVNSSVASALGWQGVGTKIFYDYVPATATAPTIYTLTSGTLAAAATGSAVPASTVSAGSGTPGFNTAHQYQQVFRRSGGVVTGTEYDLTTPLTGQPADPVDVGLTGNLATVTATPSAFNASFPNGGFAISMVEAFPKFVRVRIYGQGLAVSPASLTSSTSGNTVTLTGPNLTSATTYTATSTGTGFSFTMTSRAAGTATLTVTAGTAGTITYAQNADGSTATQSVGAAAALSVGTLTATPGSGIVTVSLSGGLAGGTGTGYSYTIYRSTLPNHGTPAGDVLATNTILGSTPYVDTTGTVGTVYYYRVVATDSAASIANAVPAALGAVPTTSPLAAAAAPQTKGLIVVYLGTSIYWGAALPGGQGTASTTAPPDVASPLLASLSGLPVFYSNQGANGSRVSDYLTTGDTGFTGGTIFTTFEAATNALVAAHPGYQVVFSEMFETNETTAAVAMTPATYNANETMLDNHLMADFPSCKIIHHVAPYYSPNTQNGGDYEEAGLARLAALRASEAPYVATMAALHPGQEYLGDTTAYAYFASRYQTIMTAESGPLGNYYIHPNTAGASVLGTLQAQAMYQDLFGVATAGSMTLSVADESTLNSINALVALLGTKIGTPATGSLAGDLLAAASNTPVATVAAMKADSVLAKTFNRAKGAYSYNPVTHVMTLLNDDGTPLGIVTLAYDAASGTITGKQ